MLAIHFLFLVLGRWGARILLPIVNHRRLLLGGIGLSMCAYLLLVSARTVAGATTAIMLIGVALGPVLPITTENLQRDLPISSARRILLAAVFGAAVEPWLAGYFGENSGVAQIMIVPAVGAVAVCFIALLIMLEARLMGATEKARESALLY
jgi:fucose permease